MSAKVHRAGWRRRDLLGNVLRRSGSRGLESLREIVRERRMSEETQPFARVGNRVGSHGRRLVEHFENVEDSLVWGNKMNDSGECGGSGR
jgi:hypothetical protein